MLRKTEANKFLLVFALALIIFLSIPYISALSIGVEKGSAAYPTCDATNIEKYFCDDNGNLYQCRTSTWVKIKQLPRSDTCKIECINSYKEKCILECTQNGGKECINTETLSQTELNGYFKKNIYAAPTITLCPTGWLCFFSDSDISSCEKCISYGNQGLIWCYNQNKRIGYCTSESTCLGVGYQKSTTCPSGSSGNSGSNTFALPVDGLQITTCFGEYSNGHAHKGLDIISTTGDTNIKAIADGTVQTLNSACSAGDRSCEAGYGNYVLINHGNYQSLYAHLNQVKVDNGASVKKGDIIGTMGNTGDSNGIHLHFEIRTNNVKVDPCQGYINCAQASGKTCSSLQTALPQSTTAKPEQLTDCPACINAKLNYKWCTLKDEPSNINGKCVDAGTIVCPVDYPHPYTGTCPPPATRTSTPVSSITTCKKCLESSNNNKWCDPMIIGMVQAISQLGRCVLKQDRCPGNVYTYYTEITSSGECPQRDCASLCMNYAISTSYSYSGASSQQLSIPIGQCSKGMPMFVAGNIFGQQSATGFSLYPNYPVGAGTEAGCEEGEGCWCLRLNAAQFTQNTASTNYPSATVPGRAQTEKWTNPKETKNPPRSGVEQPNGVPSSGTINAQIDYKLVQAGDKITITGTVGKKCATCDGWIYTCEAFQEKACKVDPGFAPLGQPWTIKYKYEPCPAELPNQIYEEGKGTVTNLKQIFNDALTAYTMYEAIKGSGLFGGDVSKEEQRCAMMLSAVSSFGSSSGSGSIMQYMQYAQMASMFTGSRTSSTPTAKVVENPLFSATGMTTDDALQDIDSASCNTDEYENAQEIAELGSEESGAFTFEPTGMVTGTVTLPGISVDMTYYGEIPLPVDNTDRSDNAIEYIVLHHTATNNALSAINSFIASNGKASSHYLITDAGTVYYLIDEKYKANHAGCKMTEADCETPNCAKCRDSKYLGLNEKSIGIEIVNTGSASDTFTPNQYYWLKQLITDIGKRHNIPIDDTHVIAHYEVAYEKSDPSPNFDWSQIGLPNHPLLKDINGNCKGMNVLGWDEVTCLPTTSPNSPSDAGCTNKGGTCKFIETNIIYKGGYFERGLCKSNSRTDYQCFKSAANIVGCESCASAGYYWCQEPENKDIGYCSSNSVCEFNYASNSNCAAETVVEVSVGKTPLQTSDIASIIEQANYVPDCQSPYVFTNNCAKVWIETANVRKLPGTGEQIVEQATAGMQANVLDYCKEVDGYKWRYVIFNQGGNNEISGWIPESLLIDCEDYIPPQTISGASEKPTYTPATLANEIPTKDTVKCEKSIYPMYAMICGDVGYKYGFYDCDPTAGAWNYYDLNDKYNSLNECIDACKEIFPNKCYYKKPGIKLPSETQTPVIDESGTIRAPPIPTIKEEEIQTKPCTAVSINAGECAQVPAGGAVTRDAPGGKVTGQIRGGVQVIIEECKSTTASSGSEQYWLKIFLDGLNYWISQNSVESCPAGTTAAGRSGGAGATQAIETLPTIIKTATTCVNPKSFFLGKCVKVVNIQTTLNVRQDDLTNLAGSVANNQIGTISDNSCKRATVDGVAHNFWRVDYDNGVSGWSAEEYLTECSAQEASAAQTAGGCDSKKFSMNDKVEVVPGVSVMRLQQPLGTILIDKTVKGGDKGTIKSDCKKVTLNAVSVNYWEVSFENTYTGWILEDYLQLQTAAPSAATKTLQQLIDECKACQNQEKKWCIDYATTYEYCDNKCEGQFTVELTNCETTTGRATQTAAQTTCEKTAGQVCVIDYTKCEGTLVRDACEIGGVCCKGKAKEGGAVSKPATCADTMRTLMILRFAANMFLKEPETDRVCYSVCGTQYDTAAGRAPVCAKGIGSAEVPIAYKNSTYECKEQSCGSWSNKKVKIEIAGPEGNTVKTDYTVTDGNGRFSYTFDAPAADGEFTAIVSIPKDS